MKMAFSLVGAFLVLFIASFLLVMPEFILNPYYSVRYQWSHLPTEADPSPNPSIFEKFGLADSGGSYNYGSQINFSYASRHNPLTHTYHYRFANTGQNPFCVTSEGFAYLLGNVKISLFPGETKYFVLKDEGSPRQYSYKLRFYELCGWFSYSGGGLELTVPAK